MTHPHGASTGSSPLARGLRSWRPFLVFLSGIIPARAGFTDPLPRAARRPSGHPRSRGVYPRGRTAASSSSGSSPLARGLRGRGVPDRLQAGIIPARAGFTSSPLAAATTGEDHPRSRGVYPTARTSTAARRGSSPLARGLRGEPDRDVGGVGIIPARAGFTRLIVWDGCIFWGSSPLARGLPPPPERPPAGRRIIPARAGFTGRDGTGPATAADHPRSRGVYHSLSENGSAHSWIIPARAGFTNQNPRPHRRRADHPRSRGVYTTTGSSTGPRPGSSPLARGLRGDRVLRGALLGIIPARAGFTWAAAQPGPGSRDHPRSRGVYWDSEYVEGQVGGSSPLARGLLAALRAEGYIIRIIPARAGFTGRLPQRDGRLGDHPRSRGVYETLPVATLTVLGSSPLARGLRQPGRVSNLLSRIIPARAGFTSRALLFGYPKLDHPRSRGVYRGDRVPVEPCEGSSPLARGLRCGERREAGESRIIPARAGFTPESSRPRRQPRDHPRSRGVYVGRDSPKRF